MKRDNGDEEQEIGADVKKSEKGSTNIDKKTHMNSSGS